MLHSLLGHAAVSACQEDSRSEERRVGKECRSRWYCAALAVAALTTAYFARQAAMERAHFAAGAGRGCGAKDCRQTSLVVPWPVSRIAALPLLHPRVMSGAEHVAALLPGTFPVA